MVEVSMLDTTEDGNDKRRAQYPDAIRFRLPRGFRDLVKQAAQAERMPASEFIRLAIGERIERLRSSTGRQDSPSAFGTGAVRNLNAEC
jgi:hypothetical protein